MPRHYIINDQATERKEVVKTVAEQLQTPAPKEHLLVKRREEHLSLDWLLEVSAQVDNDSKQSDKFIFLRRFTATATRKTWT